ncbi:MAG: trigger factor [Gammaproteobacteria bacterium]|nr:trigger factor [Gammaproteobacteria bacterium]NIR82881.1 trigger factor [Gammaproteobacteria bacterium]NIR89990.1 trigger factor [Gammaproteobacteria bacterium]NIU04039.1 trigger factor [Gammaproteobacteria bacterium]NIV51359.1 trigger factor [Gammaproteobacteria bacterium]
MEVSVEKTEGLERRLHVEVPEERIEGEINNRLQSMRRTARVPGFRPGKVPLKVVAQRYGRQVRDEVVGEMLQSSFYDAVVKENLRPAGRPTFDPVDWQPGQGLTYTAVFEVYPELEPPRVEGLKVTRPVAEVTEADVERVIEELRSQRRTWEPGERGAEEGDRVVIDFEGRLGGETFEGGTGSKVPVELGAGRMPEALEEGLLGVQAGEERTVEVRFPENHHTEKLAGQPVTFHVKAHAVQRPVLPEAGDDLARSLGVQEGGMDALRAAVRKNMERELQETVQAQTKQRLMDALLQANTVEPPKALIKDEMERVCELRRAELAQQGIDADQLGLKPGMFEEQAHRRIALGLLLAEIVKSNHLSADKDRVRARIEAIAATYNDPQQVVQWYYADKSRLAEVESTVLEGQVVDWMLERVEITEEAMSFDELMRPGQPAREADGAPSGSSSSAE